MRIIYTLDPSYGGASSSIIDNSISLKKHGFLVDILTCDPKNSKFQVSNKIKIINQGPALGNYGFSFNLTKWLFFNRKKYDIFLIEGIWQYFSLLARLLLKNYFVFIHGALDPFFRLNNFKRIKKQIYWRLIEKKNLILSNAILLTSNEEKKLLGNTYVNTKKLVKKVIGFGILKPKINKKKVLNIFYRKFPQLKNTFFLLYLGRFHEKKGCDLLINAFTKIKKKNKVKILFAGPNSIYKKKIQNLSKRLNLNKNIIWTENSISGDLKYGAILASKSMVLFSRGENFGVSIVESLSLGRPVLISDKVNIHNEIKNYNAGFVCKNNTNDISKLINKFNDLNKSQLNKISINSLKCFKERFNLNSETNKLIQLLNSN